MFQKIKAKGKFIFSIAIGGFGIIFCLAVPEINKVVIDSFISFVLLAFFTWLAACKRELE